MRHPLCVSSAAACTGGTLGRQLVLQSHFVIYGKSSLVVGLSGSVLVASAPV
jgi:hypothetical protein